MTDIFTVPFVKKEPVKHTKQYNFNIVHITLAYCTKTGSYEKGNNLAFITADQGK